MPRGEPRSYRALDAPPRYQGHKTELVYHQHSATREEARRDIVAYIEGFYNRTRRHSAIGYLSPIEIELKAGTQSIFSGEDQAVLPLDQQTLKVTRFVGTLREHRRIQIAVALIVFLLLRVAQAAQKAVQSPTIFARLIRANLMHRRPNRTPWHKAGHDHYSDGLASARRAPAHKVVRPASTFSVSPVMNCASSPARKSTASLTADIGIASTNSAFSKAACSLGPAWLSKF